VAAAVAAVAAHQAAEAAEAERRRRQPLSPRSLARQEGLEDDAAEVCPAPSRSIQQSSLSLAYSRAISGLRVYALGAILATPLSFSPDLSFFSS
jgi:hypothetical protein